MARSVARGALPRPRGAAAALRPRPWPERRWRRGPAPLRLGGARECCAICAVSMLAASAADGAVQSSALRTCTVPLRALFRELKAHRGADMCSAAQIISVAAVTAHVAGAAPVLAFRLM